MTTHRFSICFVAHSAYGALTNCIHIALVWIGLRLVGLEGVAIAFCVLYVLYIILLPTLCVRMRETVPCR